MLRKRVDYFRARIDNVRTIGSQVPECSRGTGTSPSEDSHRMRRAEDRLALTPSATVTARSLGFAGGTWLQVAGKRERAMPRRKRPAAARTRAASGSEEGRTSRSLSPDHWPLSRKLDAVLRLNVCRDPDAVSRELKISAVHVARWRDELLKDGIVRLSVAATVYPAETSSSRKQALWQQVQGIASVFAVVAVFLLSILQSGSNGIDDATAYLSSEYPDTPPFAKIWHLQGQANSLSERYNAWEKRLVEGSPDSSEGRAIRDRAVAIAEDIRRLRSSSGITKRQFVTAPSQIASMYAIAATVSMVLDRDKDLSRKFVDGLFQNVWLARKRNFSLRMAMILPWNAGDRATGESLNGDRAKVGLPLEWYETKGLCIRALLNQARLHSNLSSSRNRGWVRIRVPLTNLESIVARWRVSGLKKKCEMSEVSVAFRADRDVILRQFLKVSKEESGSP